jgi:hypothetical protein
MHLWQILVLGLVILYIISPFDLLPDIFPVVGWFDDLLALVGAYWYFVRRRAYPRPGGTADSSRGFKDREPTSPGSDNGQEQTQHADNARAAADPWQVLQVTPQASAQEIAAAYKAQLLKYHPDRVAHLGDEFQFLAHRKTLEIQQAYKKLKHRSV